MSAVRAPHPARQCNNPAIAKANDEPKPQPKKRSIFSRFGDNNHANEKTEERPGSSHHFSLTGRKRAESGAGSELKPMPKPSTEAPVEAR